MNTKSSAPLALLALAILATLAPGQRARAQDPDVEDDEVADVAAVNQPQFNIGEENFNAWVFGNSREPKTARDRLDTQLRLRVDELARVAHLSDAQKKRIELAGRGDVKRFFDLVEEKRKAFQLVRHDQNKFGQFYQELVPLQRAINAGLYDESSIFARTLRKALDPEQSASYGRTLRERALFRYRAQVAQVVANLDNSVVLKADQRRRLLGIIDEETRPPKKHSQYDSYVVLYQLAKLPEARLKPLFNETQWRLFRQQLTNAERLEQFLLKQDVLPDAFPTGANAFADDPNGPKPVPNRVRLR